MKKRHFSGNLINWAGEGIYELSRRETRQEKQWWPARNYASIAYAMRTGCPVEWIEEDDTYIIDPNECDFCLERLQRQLSESRFTYPNP